MVGQISVFPDVGGAFFGSYRQARSQRLQEAAMRAEMAAAQADRQRQAQARESFARLQGPDQVTAPDRVGQTIGLMGTRLREAGIDAPDIGAPTQRVVREGLTPEQRAREEQRLAQANPELYSGYRQSQARPGVDIPEGVYENLGAAVARGDISAEGAVARLTNAGVPQQEAVGRLGMYIVPEGQEPGFEVVTGPNGERMQRGPDGRLYALPGAPTSMDRLAGAIAGRGAGIVQPSPGRRQTGAQLAELGYQGYDSETLYEPVFSGGRFQRFEPVQEGDPDAENDAAQALGRQESQAQTTGIVTDDASQVLDALMQDPGLSGTGREQYANFVSGSQVATVNARLGTIQANVGFDELQEMRDNSPTGGALGQVSEREIDFLQALRGNISIGLDAPELAYNIARLANIQHYMTYGMDFNGDGRIDENDRFVDESGQLIQSRVDAAMRQGPYGNPEEIRNRVRARRAEIRQGGPYDANRGGGDQGGVIRIDAQGNIIED